MRCIALAQAWQDHGGKVTFISHCESTALRERIIEEGFSFIPIEHPHPHPDDLSQTINYVQHLSPFPFPLSHAWLVLDGYHFTPDYQKAIRDAGIRLLIIDDMNHLPHYHADILLNQNIHAPELNYSCDEDTIHLLGTRYVLLRREFLKYKDFKRTIPKKAKNILVTLGGADADNVTLRVIAALNLIEDADIEVKVVVGPANPNIESLRRELALSPFPFHLLQSVNNMPELMAWADVAVSAGGSTCWEMAFLVLPNMILYIAENQRPIAEKLHETGAALSLGWGQKLSINAIAENLVPLLVSQERRNGYSRRSREIVDGRGPERLLHEMFNAS
jgi:UDP-2,4-diacetamido-2,4,6-trideoxy-beta-L-altropyranose hydrolase